MKNINYDNKLSGKKVIVGISGGVDSSVAAHLLKKQGFQVYGLFMKNWEEDDNDSYCSATADLDDAKAICDQLGIELLTINFAAEYWDNVFEHFLAEYQAGRTPNPDVLCNKEIKFKVFLDYCIKDLGADYIATGHYVRCQEINGKPRLLRGIDVQKDQSYFLYTLNELQFKKTLFPIGDFEKSKVREIAADLNLVTAQKKDSTGICFIGERKFRDFLARYLPAKPGKILTTEGEVIGEHHGIMYYTLGQRKGLGIGGRKHRVNAPWYVIDKKVTSNELIVAQGNNHTALFSKGLVANKLHWIDGIPLTKELKCTVKTRYRQPDIPCTLLPVDNGQVKVFFKKPVSAVAPGQSAVFYHNEICLGGGIIEETI